MTQIAGMLSNIYILAIGFLILGVLIAFLKVKIKGKIGEWVVQKQAKRYLDERYILLNDVTLPDERSGTTQIDHILLSQYGIFVIETKNYKGWIFGGLKQKTWIQKIYKNTYKFQNPIHQNYKHLKVLENILDDIVEPEYIYSLIVFMTDCEFKTPMPDHVFKGKAWVEYVKTFQEEVISPIKLKRIQMTIEKMALDKSWQTNRKHVENLKTQKQVS